MDAWLDVHAVVQAGGKGTRLLPATEAIPKPMLAVSGVPMVERIVRRLVGCGVPRITVVVGHRGSVVRDHLQGLSLPNGVLLDFIEEPPERPLGNVGALGCIRIEAATGLIAFGDLVTDLDFADLVVRRCASGADLLLASHWEDHRLQLGELAVDGVRVTGYHEKPLKRFLICSGIVAFDPRTLSVIPTDGKAFGLSDWVNAALKAGYRVEHWRHGAFWMDVNSQELLAEADRQMAEADAEAQG